MTDERAKRATEATDSPSPPKRTSGDADTMPAVDESESRRAEASGDDGDGDDGRERRPTIPDIAPMDNRYRLGVELGRGGMGRVVEAFDIQLGRTVALKEVLPKTSTRLVEKRFAREVQITARLEHPSIVPLYDSGRMPDGRPFYVMRRVTGRPLDELIGRARDLPERLVLLPNVLAAIDAVGHAHRRGIIHRDLKPGNILIGENGETVVIDWGLAKVIGEEDDPPAHELRVPSAADSLETQAGSVFGTPGFMPPEQARGEGLGPHGDVFALGATLYQLLVGRPPIGGKSATDVLASSIQRRITPVAEAAPGAPAELLAIVEKALAFEPGDRYPDAELLAEDLRRFLAGQLVAAHRYTTRERVVRFAKRHRAPLSVAALALAALAVLAWIGVHRILVERDVATKASIEANDERNAVQTANAKLKEHDDALLIARARALVDTNPTAALAMLRDLAPGSARACDARGLAASAAVHGVAFGIRADGVPRVLDIDHGATRLAELTGDGTIHVWDLDTHRVLYERMYDAMATPRWLGDGRLLLSALKGAEILDVKSGQHTKLPIANVTQVDLDDSGMQFAYISNSEHSAGVFDVATGTFKVLDGGHHFDSARLSPDGTWAALTESKQTIVVDVATGATVATHAGTLMVLSTAADRIGGVLDNGVVIEWIRGTSGAWTERVLEIGHHDRVLMLAYRGTVLDVMTTDGIFFYVDGQEVGHRPLDVVALYSMARIGRDMAITQTTSGTLSYFGGGLDGTLALPVPMDNIRIAGRRGQTRFAVAGNGLVLVYDLNQILPTFAPKTGMFEATFLDSTTLFMWPEGNLGYSWYDIPTGQHVEVDLELGPPLQIFDRDPHDGRMLLFQEVGKDRARLWIAHKGKRVADPVAIGPLGLRALLAPGGVLLAQRGDARVLLFEQGTPTPRELAKVEGGVASLAILGRKRFAALGGSGELIRGELAGGGLERVRIDPVADTFIGPDRDGNVVIASGTRISIWQTGAGIRDLATLPRAPDHIQVAGAGLVAMLDDGSVEYIEPNGSLHQLAQTGAFGAQLGGDGSWLVAHENGGGLSVVELPSLVRWTVPARYGTGPDRELRVAPSGRRLMESGIGGYQIVDLPEPSGDLSAWIEDRTNAFETADGTLAWPWQRQP